MKRRIFLVLTLLVFSFSNVKAADVYEPIGTNPSFEEYNQKKYQDYPIIQTKAITDINQYIIENDLKPATITLKYDVLSKVKSQYKCMSYKTLNSRPKGVVVHSTAGGNNDSMQKELNYMANNWKSAFVHAFADDKTIIETHNPECAAWGAGIKANPYYIHIELIETGNNEKFIASINNQAYYVALKLNDFNLKPSRAKQDKSGSVWFHSEVTKYLKGTDHSDPTGFFKKHNYSLAEFYELVVYHFNKLENNYAMINNDQYYENGLKKTEGHQVYYKGKLVETGIITYDEFGQKIGYTQTINTLKGKLLDKKYYTYLKNDNGKTINNYSKFVVYNYKGQRKNSTIRYKDNLGLIKEERYYEFNTKKNIVKSRYVTIKQKVNGKYYKKRYEILRYDDNGLKVKVERYDYNKRGQLKSNKYGKAKRVIYKYNKGKLKQRETRYYSKYGWLTKKVYLKKY